MSAFSAVKLTDRVYWVGAIDWALRDFHGYRTGRGTTYNAYLLMADRPTLVDTVKRPFHSEMMSRIASVTDPEDIEVVISNHSEMDHSGSLPATIEAVSPDRVLASVMGRKALASHFHWDPETVEAVRDGDTIDLGGMTVSFLETRMLHWPDSMVSYVPEERVLFSQDGFGMHLASTERFDDQLPQHVLDEEAAKYYANILMPFSPVVSKLMARLGELDLDIGFLCPDHGPVWRSGIGRILGQWSEWAAQEPSMKAVIVYDTMWGSTAKLADAVTNGLSSKGVSVRVMPLGSAHRSDVATELLDAGALLAGSPTINGQVFPTVAACMTYIGSLRPKNLTGAAFGSYGWSGESVGRLESMLDDLGVERAAEGLKVNYVPTPEDMTAATGLGEAVGDRLAAFCGEEG